ncbi:hypothetical protein RB195_023335 [Necator americanus]|uniref:Uncharacterized protein n=1 Tax=Necator americanus TaxID=51031 RepID=A0ABR1EIQ9_NECAM
MVMSVIAPNSTKKELYRPFFPTRHGRTPSSRPNSISSNHRFSIFSKAIQTTTAADRLITRLVNNKSTTTTIKITFNDCLVTAIHIMISVTSTHCALITP